MNSGQKTAVSMLITVVLFAAFLFTAYSPLFSKIETKFYQPERIEQERARVKESSDYCNTYIQNFLKTTEEYAKADCIQSYFSQTPSESDVQARVQITGELFTNVSGLDGLRLVDKNGRNLHFSTYSEDIAKQNGTARVYKNYADIQAVPGESSFELISIPDSDGPKTPKITFNEEKGLINISHPIEDKYGVYRGTFVFYCKTGNIEKGLIKENLISVTDSLTLFTDQNGKKGGFVIGLPKVGRELFQTPVKDSWKEKSAGPDRVLESEDNKYWVSLSDYSSDIFSISEIYTNDYFELPGTTRILICICVFITVFLIVFLIFSFKTDDMVVIRSRIKKIQFAFVSEYLENKESVDWELVSNQIEGRKADLFRDVKQSLGRKGRKHEKQVDLLLNKSWDEILSAIGTKKEYVKSVSMNDAATSAELKRMLEEVLSTTKIKLEDTRTSVASAGPVVTAQSSSEVEDIEDIEDADIVEDADVIEEADTVEEISEEIETVEDADAVEEVESVEEVDAVDEADAVEEVDSVEEISEEIETVEDADAVEEVESVEEVGAVEEVDVIEEADTVEEISEEIETVEDADAVEEVESVEEVDVIEETIDETAAEEIADSESEEKIEEVEDESETKEDIISEVVDVPESNEVIAEVTETEDEELFEDSVENAIPPEDEVSVSVITPEPAEEFIESEEEEVPSDEIREISNNEETIEEEIQEEVLEDAQTVTETEEIEDIEECEEAETAEEDLEEVLEAEEEMPAAVPEETSEPAPVIPDFHISEDDLTFASDTEDGFATVDNVFAEELRFGEPYIKKPIFDEIETDLTFNFELSSPDFGITEELLPVEDNSFFSMTGFGANNNNVQELDASPETIEEIDGIYSISRNLEIPKMDLDKDFKKLVDAVLG